MPHTSPAKKPRRVGPPPSTTSHTRTPLTPSLPTLAETTDQIRRGQCSPVDLVELCLSRIHQFDDRLRAWVFVDEEGARREAQRMADEAAAGRFRGPLHGVPVGIKDIIDVQGWPTRAGSPLRENIEPAEQDAPVVAALRAAGAILLGKTVTVEFACFDPPPTRNPWDPQLGHTPGGSSSGSAVAVATGMCLGALGTQTGGSLVRPSTYCGIATCKPTFGRVSRQGVVPVSYHFDHVGPMARRVADLALMLRCLPHSDDFGPPGGLTASTPATTGDGQAARPPRLGLLSGFFHNVADPAIRELVASAVERLRRAGATVELVQTDVDFAMTKPMHRRIMAVEGAAYHRANFTAHHELYGSMIAEMLDLGLATSAADYAEALAWQRQFRREVVPLVESYDALLCPSTHTTAPATLAHTGTSECQAPWSMAGLPVVSIPCGLADDGMPGAVQLVGRWHHDTDLLTLAQWCEPHLGLTNVPPILTEG
ncbi:MAG: amidase [Pirellulales bacterium]|nr:amidase [Pirellulales bacterium]